MTETARKSIASSSLLLIIIGVVVGVGGYYLGASKQAKIRTQSTTQANLPQGYSKAQQLINSGRGVITQSRIQLTYVGTLKSSSDKSWTIERVQKEVTITHEGDGVVRYLRSNGEGQATQSIEPNTIKVGDRVHISTLVDLQTGKITVNTVVLLPPQETTQ